MTSVLQTSFFSQSESIKRLEALAGLDYHCNIFLCILVIQTQIILETSTTSVIVWCFTSHVIKFIAAIV